MKRIKAGWDANPRKALLSLCALAVASAVIMASGANFTSQTANATAFTAGDLKHGNTPSAAFLSATEMKPGDSKTGTVDIENTGDIPGVFTLTKDVTAETAGFASKLKLVLTDCKADGCGNANDTNVHNGSIDSMGTEALGTFASAEVHRYEFVVSFPDADAGSSPATNGSDNAYKNATASTTFNWESVNN